MTRIKQIIFWLSIFSCGWIVPMSVAEDKEPSACPLPFGTWEAIPEFSDEFSGTKLDDTKWVPFNPDWKGRQPGFFSKENVEVKEGMLHLYAKAETLPDLPEGYHTFTTAAVQSIHRVRYGYFEIRCRPMNSAASSAFWFYAGNEKFWTEIDVFEICGKSPAKTGNTAHTPADIARLFTVSIPKDRSYFTTVHVWRTPETGDKHWSDSKTWTSPYRLAEDFHVYGFLWSKEELIWYADGKEIRKRKNTDWHQTLTMNFDSETMPNWFGLPDPKDLPSVFSIDYVRSWKRLDGDTTTIEPVVK